LTAARQRIVAGARQGLATLGKTPEAPVTGPHGCCWAGKIKKYAYDIFYGSEDIQIQALPSPRLGQYVNSYKDSMIYRGMPSWHGG
jgi:hypothetical protein